MVPDTRTGTAQTDRIRGVAVVEAKAAESESALKRVAVVYPFFPHYREAVLRALHRDGSHDYHFFTDTVDKQFGLKPCSFEEGQRTVHTRTWFLKKRFLWQMGMIRLALSPRYDTVIYHGDPQYVTTWLSAALARLSGKRVLFWTIGWLRQEGGLKDLVRTSFYRLAHGLLFYGRYARKLALERGFAADRLHVIYNSLDYERQKQVREQVGQERLAAVRDRLFPRSDKPMLVCTSRLVPKRKLEELLQAMHLLKSRGHEVNLLLIGDGPERARLDAIAMQLKLNVVFYGACYDEEELAPLLMAANVTVAPGMVGLTAMHSLAYGTPVITHDDFDHQAPEWEAIVPGRCGGFFEYGDVSALARVIEEWTQTPRKSEEVVLACYEAIEGFYNPAYQVRAIENAVSGKPSLESF